MGKTLTLILWIGRMAVEACEIVVRGKRALDQTLDNGPWRRPSPWYGDRGGFWQGR